MIWHVVTMSYTRIREHMVEVANEGTAKARVKNASVERTKREELE